MLSNTNAIIRPTQAPACNHSREPALWSAYPHCAFPSLDSRHLHDARLFADRRDMIKALSFPADAVIAELGVAFGDFSLFLIDQIKPRIFAAFDLFELHNYPEIWGVQPNEIFGDKTHEDWYRDTTGNTPCEVRTYKGFTRETLASAEDKTFDLIYIDAGHAYEDVKPDSELAVRKVKPSGLLIFNDYIMLDHHYGTPYGVVQAVNELVTDSDWKVIGLSLQQHMFCDVALSRCIGRVWS